MVPSRTLTAAVPARAGECSRLPQLKAGSGLPQLRAGASPFPPLRSLASSDTMESLQIVTCGALLEGQFTGDRLSRVQAQDA